MCRSRCHVTDESEEAESDYVGSASGSRESAGSSDPLAAVYEAATRGRLPTVSHSLNEDVVDSWLQWRRENISNLKRSIGMDCVKTLVHCRGLNKTNAEVESSP